ncbi:MAG TPA: SDR family oxidoreductase [Myxococcaceae bacterium]|nr:SDR family oxidoreductase [Myxococcaceae bacterium]
MRVFVTGATGFIGTAVVAELLAAGHTVLGLTRSDAGAETLKRLGAEVHRGELSDLDSLAAGARAADGVIHLAFVHDFRDYARSIETDRTAIRAMTRALEGTDRPFVGTSGTLLLAPGHTGIETDGPPTEGHVHPRARAEGLVLGAVERGVRASLIRLAPTVHGRGDHQFVPFLVNVARQKGFAAYVGDGSNRWPAVHRLDAARLFRVVLEKAPAASRFHAVAEEGIPMRSIAETIGRGLGVPARSIPADQASAHFDWMALFVGVDNPTSSALTRKTLGWNPDHPGLLTDLRENGYFA